MKKGELIPGLATEWQSNEDATEWTFTLRDATFHNGEKSKCANRSQKISIY
ncbi:ABC transporter substrate-binding protein [Actinobacillus pleuropneumoniae]|nr:ABC transporter substrate-binding protein [Actinobacillus pleuropneumoniae]